MLLFTLYISFTQYDIFTAPVWVGLQNYAQAFQGFVNPIQAQFLQSIYNVIWYTIIVVPLQTAAAIVLALMLNSPMQIRKFFRMVFYAPSVTSSVVITLIFMWFYLKTGYINFAFAKFLGLFGVPGGTFPGWGSARADPDHPAAVWRSISPLTSGISSGPSVAWMAICSKISSPPRRPL